jgi:hypothetical protein
MFVYLFFAEVLQFEYITLPTRISITTQSSAKKLTTYRFELESKHRGLEKESLNSRNKAIFVVVYSISAQPGAIPNTSHILHQKTWENNILDANIHTMDIFLDNSSTLNGFRTDMGGMAKIG